MLCSAWPSTPISAASQTESSREAALWVEPWISSCCLTSESRAFSASDQCLDLRVRGTVGVERGGDQRRGVAGHVAELHGRGGGDAGSGAGLELLADLHEVVDEALLRRCELGAGSGGLQRGQGLGVALGRAVVGRAHLVGEGRRQGEALGRVEVGDGRAEDGGVLLVRRVAIGRGELGADAKSTEDRGEDDRDREHGDDLAAHRPLGHTEGRKRARDSVLTKFRQRYSRDSSPTRISDRGSSMVGHRQPGSATIGAGRVVRGAFGKVVGPSSLAHSPLELVRSATPPAPTSRSGDVRARGCAAANTSRRLSTVTRV